MVKLTLKSDSADLLYTNPDYEVFHVTEKDYQSDTLILACTEDGTTKQILIPTDRIFLTKNIPFFEAMFRESSNWIEGNDDMDDIKWDNQKIVKIQKADGSDLLAKKVLLPDPMQPEIFAKYMKSLYAKSIDIDSDNCVDFYRVVDYFQDKKTLEIIIQYIKQNITFENAITLMSMSNLFNDEIEKFYKENNVSEYLSDSNNLSKFLISMARVNLPVFQYNLGILDDLGLSSAIFLKILENQITAFCTCNFTDIIDSILIQSSSIIKKFNFNEKFVIYNHCVNTLQHVPKEERHIPYNIYELIYGDKTETLQFTQAISANSKEKVKLLKELCYDSCRQNDKSNADKIRLLQDDPEVKKIIDHRWDGKLNKLELVEACANGQIETVKALVDAGCNFNLRERLSIRSNDSSAMCRDEGDYYNYGPLTIACYKGHTSIVEYLLSQPRISFRKYYAGNGLKLDALQAACRRENNKEIIDLLTERYRKWNFHGFTEDCVPDMVAYAKEKEPVSIFVETLTGKIITISEVYLSDTIDLVKSKT